LFAGNNDTGDNQLPVTMTTAMKQLQQYQLPYTLKGTLGKNHKMSVNVNPTAY
jgi:hypothetical protein